MAKVPHEDLKKLYDETSNKTWPGFKRVLLERKAHPGDIDPGVIDQLLDVTQRAENTNETFPVSLVELQHAVDRIMTPQKA